MVYFVMERVKSTFHKACGWMIKVVDCANGAAYRAAPGAGSWCGGDFHRSASKRKNSGPWFGSPEMLLRRSWNMGLMLAFVLTMPQADPDRRKGQTYDGDQLMGLLASRWASEQKLAGGALVSTVMSNLGLERFLNSQDIALLRTQVGDRYVVEQMREGGFNLGGEQSGHIVMTDYATTGDGLIAGLQFLSEMMRTGRPASETLKFYANPTAFEECSLWRRSIAT